MERKSYHTNEHFVSAGDSPSSTRRASAEATGTVTALSEGAAGKCGGPPSDSYWPFAPPGEYRLAFVREESIRTWNRKVWVVWMRVVDEGEHFGTLIPFYLNAIPAGKRPSPSMHIASAFAVATERRPPKDLWRRRPKSFLSGCVFLGRVRTVTKDSQGVELPEAAHKSRVACVLERLDGCPPCLEKERA